MKMITLGNTGITTPQNAFDRCCGGDRGERAV